MECEAFTINTWAELEVADAAAAGKTATLTPPASFTMVGYNRSHIEMHAGTAVRTKGNGATFDANSTAVVPLSEPEHGRFFEVGEKVVLELSNVTLRNGGVYRESGQGGAVFVAPGGAFTVTSTTFSANIAMGGYHKSYGGAVYVAAGGTFAATSTTFSANIAFVDGAFAAGGALYFGGGTGLIKSCSFVDPISKLNNGIYNSGGNVTFACADDKVGTPVQMQGNEITVIPPKELQCK
jgi:hypothetical protein